MKPKRCCRSLKKDRTLNGKKLLILSIKLTKSKERRKKSWCIFCNCHSRTKTSSPRKKNQKTTRLTRCSKELP